MVKPATRWSGFRSPEGRFLILALVAAAWAPWTLAREVPVPADPATPVPPAESVADPTPSRLPSDDAWTADEEGRTALFDLVARRVEEIYWNPHHVDWRDWRDRHRAEVVAAASEPALDRAFARMFDDLGDDHTRWIGVAGERAVGRPSPAADDEPAPPQLGADVRPMEGRGLLLVRVHPGGAAEAAGLRRGDVIVSVAEASLSEPGIGWGMRGMLASALRRGPTPIAVERTRARVTAVLDARPLPTGAAQRPLVEIDEDLSAARLEVPTFSAGTADAVHRELAALARAGVPYLVVDLRGNPGGSVAEMGLVLGAFAEGSLLAAYGREGVNWRLTIDRDAALEVHLARDEGRLAGRDAAFARLSPYTRWDGPLAVLVDGDTASAAEAFAGAVAGAAGAVVVGASTAGNVETIRRIAFPGGRAAMVAVGDLRRADGEPVAPVQPDAEARLDHGELARGLDAPFAEAVRLLRGFSWVPGTWF